MITPNKVTSTKETILPTLPKILAEIPGDVTIDELYQATAKSFDATDKFLAALDTLYILGRIDFDPETGKVIYVD